MTAALAAAWIETLDPDVRTALSAFAGHGGDDAQAELMWIVNLIDEDENLELGIDIQVTADGDGDVSYSTFLADDRIPLGGVYVSYSVDWKDVTNHRSATGLDAALGYAEVIFEYADALRRAVDALRPNDR